MHNFLYKSLLVVSGLWLYGIVWPLFIPTEKSSFIAILLLVPFFLLPGIFLYIDKIIKLAREDSITDTKNFWIFIPALIILLGISIGAHTKIKAMVDLSHSQGYSDGYRKAIEDVFKLCKDEGLCIFKDLENGGYQSINTFIFNEVTYGGNSLEMPLRSFFWKEQYSGCYEIEHDGVGYWGNRTESQSSCDVSPVLREDVEIYPSGIQERINEFGF